MSLANKMARAQAMGDPGFLGSIWKGIKGVAKAAVGVAGAVLPGPVGMAVRAGGGLLFPGRPQITPRTQLPAPALPGVGRPVAPQWKMQIPPFTPYPLVSYQEGGVQPGAAPGAPAGLPPRGYRANKSGYFVHAGPAGTAEYNQGIWVPPRSQFVRSRRRNPLNPRALDRAASRITSFANADSRSRKKVKAAARKVG